MTEALAIRDLKVIEASIISYYMTEEQLSDSSDLIEKIIDVYLTITSNTNIQLDHPARIETMISTESSCQTALVIFSREQAITEKIPFYLLRKMNEPYNLYIDRISIFLNVLLGVI